MLDCNREPCHASPMKTLLCSLIFMVSVSVASAQQYRVVNRDNTISSEQAEDIIFEQDRIADALEKLAKQQKKAAAEAATAEIIRKIEADRKERDADMSKYLAERKERRLKRAEKDD